MTKILTIDEMLAVSASENLAGHDEIVNEFEKVGTKLAKRIAGHLNVECGEAHNDSSEFGGTLVAFFPRYEGQECPEPLSWYDQEEWG